MISKILGFLFGKEADIFDKDGQVRHKLPDQRWKAWKNRYQSEAQYNWRNHTGMKARERRPTR